MFTSSKYSYTRITVSHYKFSNYSIPSISDNVRINTGHNITIPTGKIATAGSLFNAGTLYNNGTLQLGTLSLNASTTTLYSLDYKYHIRGGLKGINLDVNNNLTNSLFSYKLDYEEDGTYYDGNIRNQYWKSNIDGIQRAYQYNYDGASRITVATYGSTKAGENYALNNVNYDANGNILSLSRNGATNTNYTSFGNVDNLSYTYQTNSNKLLKIQDATIGNPDLGDFRDGTNTNNDYEYWEDGSLKKDKNKKIASITYNYLKLPKTITFDNGRTITTQYDAQGSKLKKIDSNGETTDYEEDEIYVNNVLYQTSHDEGRIVNGVYEYNIIDHLGNLRVSLKDSAGIATPTQSIFYDPWGLSMKGMAITRNPTNFNKFQFLNRETQFETGYIDLIHRQFDPAMARFISQDPVIEGQEHLSLYQYSWNNPILKSDPDGMMAIPFFFDDKPKSKVKTEIKNPENSQGTYGIPLYTNSTQALGVIAGYTVGYNNNTQYGGVTGNLTGFRVEYNNNTGTGEANLALDGGVKATGFQATTNLRGGTENNNISLGAEGNALLAEAKGTVGKLTGENNKRGYYLGGEAGVYGLKGELNPAITVFGYKLGLVIGGSLGSTNIGAGLGAFRDTGKGTYNLSGFISGSFIAGGKLGFEIVTPSYNISKKNK